MNFNAARTSEAWLLECGSTRVLLSLVNMQHVVEASQLFHVPMTPSHCNTMLVWQQLVMPVISIATWFKETVSCPYSCIIGWQDIERGTEYGVLSASAFPQRVKVNDTDCVTPPSELAERWQQWALCFVRIGADVIPIIDPARLFGASQFEQQDVHTIGMTA